MPLAIAAIALTAAGTAMTVAGNEKSKNAINATRGQYSTQQDALARRNAGIAKKSIDASGADVANKEIADGQQARMNVWDQLQKSTVPVASALPATTMTGKTGQASARSGGAAATWNKLNAAAAAREGGYSDWQTKQAIKNSQADQDIAVNNDFAGGNSRVLPTEIGVATQAGDQLSGWGNIVSTIGNLTGMLSSFGSKTVGTGVSDAQSAAVRAEMNGSGALGMTGSPGPLAGAFDANVRIPANTYT